MGKIHTFAESGFYKYRHAILPAAVAAPLAVEGAILAKNLYQHPSFLKEKAIEIKNKCIDAFNPRVGETRQQAITRIARNALILISCLALMAVAGYLSTHLLPGAFGISFALSSIYLIGKLFVNAKSYKTPDCHLIFGFGQQI